MRQGDQIGRIFADWSIVSIVQRFVNDRSSGQFRATFSHGTNDILNLTTFLFGYILGDFWQTHLVTLARPEYTDERDRTQTCAVYTAAIFGSNGAIFGSNGAIFGSNGAIFDRIVRFSLT
jgi:hypothetical protein